MNISVKIFLPAIENPIWISPSANLFTASFDSAQTRYALVALLARVGPMNDRKPINFHQCLAAISESFMKNRYLYLS